MGTLIPSHMFPGEGYRAKMVFHRYGLCWPRGGGLKRSGSLGVSAAYQPMYSVCTKPHAQRRFLPAFTFQVVQAATMMGLVG